MPCVQTSCCIIFRPTTCQSASAQHTLALHSRHPAQILLDYKIVTGVAMLRKHGIHQHRTVWIPKHTVLLSSKQIVCIGLHVQEKRAAALTCQDMY